MSQAVHNWEIEKYDYDYDTNTCKEGRALYAGKVDAAWFITGDLFI